ncbi:aminopeptidase [Ammoniphilus sp. YIM 78166]|uniref:aminopeptidase n=1 Tax=Ammoniphilus sp. YIM 78166 TaxID=1644106 RepID=UPI00106F8A9B|nr:aminopeptidase [Ammoniphilus sp. YIM 78166]
MLHFLEKYAELAIKVGVNIQPNQTLWVNAPIHAVDFIRLVVKKGYEAGAKHVHVEWQDEGCTRLKYDLAPNEAFHEYPVWRAKALEEIAQGGGAYLFVQSEDPELLKGVDAERITAYSKAAGVALKTWREYITTHRMSWSIVAAPSIPWAKKVFPHLGEQEAVEALWNAIFTATRADQDDPVANWEKHNATLREKVQYLNHKQYKKLHYKAPGTELTVELPKGHLWHGGATKNEIGILFNANMPTEEVYTSPVKYGTKGVVHSTKPLSYQGNLIENFWIKFENGRIVEYQAEKGHETLKAMIEIDEGAHYLGEIALVPHHSPISSSNLIYYNTLFDENASSHLAIGNSFASCLEGGSTMSKEQLAKVGLNDSITHVDFMIGSAEMDIDGETEDGKREAVFRRGNWAF